MRGGSKIENKKDKKKKCDEQQNIGEIIHICTVQCTFMITLDVLVISACCFCLLFLPE